MRTWTGLLLAATIIGCGNEGKTTDSGQNTSTTGVAELDSDGDGVPDVDDLCDGGNDTVDSDSDGAADFCDVCPNDAQDDSDGDGSCDSDDLCADFDDSVDADTDGVPDLCDVCPIDAQDDTDGDGACDSDDLCPGSDDTIDVDGDGAPDDCDVCPADINDDSDGDGSCDTDDICIGGDDFLDDDMDAVPNDCDICPLDFYDDSDGDSVCDTDDICPLNFDDLCAAAQLDLWPQTGTLIETDSPFYTNKGYEFTTLQDFTITGGAWWIDMPAGGYVSLSIYGETGILLARGTQGTGTGLGGEEWYQSDLVYNFIAGQTYTASFYTNLAMSSFFDRYDSPSYGYSVDGLIDNVTHRASSAVGDYGSEEFPDYLGNSWAPIQRLDVR